MADPGGELLLLVPTTSYRLDDFRSAARRLGVALVVGSDRCHKIEDFFGEERELISLDHRRPERAAEQIVEAARSRPIRGIVAASDPTAVIAALAAARLGLPHNPPAAARRAANKHAMRVALREAGLPVPSFRLFRVDADPELIAASGGPAGGGWLGASGGSGGAGFFGPPGTMVPYPCVLKPLIFSASRGVIRADDSASFVAAWRRIAKLLRETEAERRAREGDAARGVLVESFVPGAEVALEGLLRGGRLEVLAVFDKPDPLDGPFFEETIYVTPSRQPPELVAQVEQAAAAGARALGLVEGPIHAELRLAAAGPVILEVAARSIGGLCSRTLRFGAGLTLEEVLVAHAMGLPLERLRREARASGVMMLPIPRRGVLHSVAGLEAARAVPGVEDIVITVPQGREVVPLPEGDSYLGFLFAKGETPAAVEAALREAHRRLSFDIRAPLPTTS